MIKEQQSKYSGLTYKELLIASNHVKQGKDARELHEELKKHGDGLPIWNRYPWLRAVVSAVVSFLTSEIIIITVMLRSV